MLSALRIFLIGLILIFSSAPSFAQPEEEEQTPDEQASQEQQPQKNKKDHARTNKLFADIYEKRKTVKKSPDWLKQAYSGLKIRSLNDIPRGEYKSYQKHLFNNNVYIIVHPAYYLFFQNNSLPQAKEMKEGFPLFNVPERFAADIPADAVNLKVMAEQGRLLEDFIELFSTEKRLVILILPRDYKSHVSFGYTPGLDEFARYINDITNMSESVLYMESETHEDGFMGADDLELLTGFLKEIGTRNILLGGGYLGKCIDNFYESLRKKYRHDEVFFVTELSAISPNDMVTDSLKLMTKSGRINFKEVKKYLKFSGVTAATQEEKAKFKRITSYKVYR